MDTARHHFILHTRGYQEFCERYIGKFLHHNPTERHCMESRAEMLALAERLFGEIDRSLWSKREVQACDSGGTEGDNYCSENWS